MNKIKIAMAVIVVLLGAAVGNSFTLGVGPANSGYNIDIDQEETAIPSSRHEAVFSMLDHTGTVVETRVLNHLTYDESDSRPWVVDYGRYGEIKNLTSGVQGYAMNDRVYWPVEAFQDGDLYYEGYFEKQLPVATTIRYRLDGKEITADALQGASGKLEIILSFENVMSVEQPIAFSSSSGKKTLRQDDNYIPFVVQGTVPMDLSKFSNISVDSGAVVEVGQTANVSFMMFPYPKAETMISADAEDIELDPMTITLMPQMPPVSDMDMADDLKELLSGLGDMQKGMESLYEGLNAVTEGTQTADQGISGMIEQIVFGLDAVESGMLELSGGLQELQEGLVFAEGSMGQLFEGLSMGADEIEAGLTALYEASDGMLAGLEELNEQAKAVLEPMDPILDNIDETLEYLESLEAETMLPLLEDLAAMLDQLLNSLREQSQEELQISLDQFNIHAADVYRQKGELDQTLAELIQADEKIQQAAESLMEDYPPESELYQLGVLLKEQGDRLVLLNKNSQLIAESLAVLEESAAILEGNTEEIVSDIVTKLEQLLIEIAELNDVDPAVFDMLFVYLNNSIEYIRQLQLTLPQIREQLDEIRNLPGYLDQLVEGQRSIRDGIQRIRDEGLGYLTDGIDQAASAFSLQGILQAVGIIEFGARAILEEGLNPLQEGVNTARQSLSLEPLIEAQAAIADGMSRIIDEGLKPMRSGLASGVDEILFAEEKLLLMEKLAENYRSFADNDRNQKSQVRFIMQTPALTLAESNDDDADTSSEEASFFQELLIRIKRLFEGE